MLPATLVDETFRQNGASRPRPMHRKSRCRLRDFFGADAAVYIKVTEYGTSYAVVSSETRVGPGTKVVDLRSGELLWRNKGRRFVGRASNSRTGAG